jgi:hypothetical protein
MITRSGYKQIAHFPLPEDAWWDLYYTPLEKRIKSLKIKYKDDPEALKYLDEEREEIDLFRKYNRWYGSVFYIMQKE